MRTVTFFLGACVLAACGGGDPGGTGSTQATQELPPNASSSGSGSGGGSGGTGSSSGSSSTSSSSGSGSSGSTPTPVVDAGPPPVNDPVVPGVLVPDPTDAFSGAGSYVSNPPTIRANDQHASGISVTGKPCLTCHDGTTCVKFDFAGTVWTAPALTDGAADVNVRIIDANNYAYSVYSDVDGNFWHRADTDLAMPALSGVRTADWKAIGTLNGTSCNSCHYTGNTGADAPPGPRLFVDP